MTKTYIITYKSREVLLAKKEIQAKDLAAAQELAQLISPEDIKLLWEQQEYLWEIQEVVERKGGQTPREDVQDSKSVEQVKSEDSALVKSLRARVARGDLLSDQENDILQDTWRKKI